MRLVTPIFIEGQIKKETDRKAWTSITTVLLLLLTIRSLLF